MRNIVSKHILRFLTADQSYVYLKACFWSIYEQFPNIAMGVTQTKDVLWGKNDSGMPWYLNDVIFTSYALKEYSM